MTSNRLIRALTTVALATAMAGTGGGAATAVTPPDGAPSRSTSGYAFAFLGSSDVFLPFDVFAPSGTAAFGTAEIYVQDYECFAQNTVAATVDELTTATARGQMALQCYLHAEEPAPDVPLSVQGTAHVDLTWTGEGAVQRSALAGRDSTCVAQLQVRHAVVTGQVRVVIPQLDIDQSAITLADDDDSLRYEEAVCPPQQ